MEERWWLERGVVIEADYYLYKIYGSAKTDDRVEITKRTCAWYGDYLYNRKYKLRGVPFDNLRGDETEISFDDDHSFFTVHPGGERHGYSREKFPEEWRGKTFPITEELKRLLKGETL